MTRIEICLALALAGLGTPAVAQTVGANAVVVNDVRMATQVEPQIHQARVRERVSLGNPVNTGRASHVQILLRDGTSFQVGANARLVIDRFVYDPDRSASAVGAEVARGSFRFMSGRPTRATPGGTAIRTPAAAIGVRGTIVEGVVGEDAINIARFESGVPGVTGADPESASLILLRGPGGGPGEPAGAIDVTAGGVTMPVESVGYAVFVPATGQPPVGPFLISDHGLAELATLLGDPRRGVPTLELNPLIVNPLINEELGDRGRYGQSPGTP
jgi:hypothetical protein